VSDQPEVLEGETPPCGGCPASDNHPPVVLPFPRGDRRGVSPRPAAGRGAGGEGATAMETPHRDGDGNLAPFERGIKSLSPGTVMNGRISRPGEVDRYRLSVTPGQHWNFEIEAATLGTSQLLGLISLYNAENDEFLASSDEKISTDPYLVVSVPEKVKEIIVQIEDLLGRGGSNYGYRLQAVQEPAGFAIEILDPNVNVPQNGTAAVEFRLLRRGYDGAARISIPDLPDGLVLSGGHVPADPPGSERSNLPNHFTLTAKEGAKPRSGSLEIWGEALSSEVSLRTQAGAPGMMVNVAGVKQKPFKAPWLGSDLPMAVVKPIPLSLEVPIQHVRIPQGSEFELRWKLVHPSSVMLPIKVDRRTIVNIRQINFVKTPEDPHSPDQGGVTIKTTLATPTTIFDVVFDGMVQGDGKSEVVVTAPAVTVEIVPLYTIKLEAQKLRMSPGQRLEVSGQIEREPGFKGSVKIGFEGLPEHVTSSEAIIAENESQFRLRIEAGPQTKPQGVAVRLISSAIFSEGKEAQPYSIPEMKVSLTISKLGTTQ